MTSKFRGIIDAAKMREPGREAGATPEPPPVAAAPIEPPPPSPALVETPSGRKPGRPPGKRSDPRFVQVTAYIPSDLHHNVKLALLMERKGREFSELIGELLAEWLKSRF